MMTQRRNRWMLAAALSAPMWLVGLSHAQPTAHAAARGNGYVARLDRAVGLSSDQRETLKGLMAQQREKTQALRAETDAKFRAVLTPEQQKRFDAFQADLKASRKTSK